jgi:hypothetical protein
VKFGERSRDPVKIWRELTTSKRREICNAFWGYAKPEIVDRAVRLLSERFHSREQTVRHWPSDKCANLLAETPDLTGGLILDILREYFFARQKPLMATFLDSLGIHHDDCAVSTTDNQTTTESILRNGISTLLVRFPRDTVELYLRILLAQDSRWLPGLSEIDLEKIEISVPSEPEIKLPGTQGGGPLELQIAEDHPTPSTFSAPSLHDALEPICQSFAAAAKLLQEAASDLSAGILPETGLEQRLFELRSNVGKYSNSVLTSAKGLNIEPAESFDNSLTKLRELLARVQDAEKALELRQQELKAAISVLDSILRLERKDGRDFPALLNCQNAARALQEKLTDSKTENHKNAFDNIKAFKTLLLMVDSRERLSEDESALAYDEISKAFGTPLVVAVERGLVVLSSLPKAEPETRSPKSGEARGDAATELLSAEERPTFHIEESDPVNHQDLFKEPEVPSNLTIVPPHASHVEEKSLPAQHFTLQFVDDSAFQLPKEKTAEEFASELLASDQEPQYLDIERLAWLALGERRVSSAYQLVCCVERLWPDLQLSISSSLIRAFALSTEGQQSSDDIATQLKTDFAQLVDSLDRRSSNQALASRLMLVSAAICAAISTPVSGGSQALKIGVQKLSGLSKLYSLCSDISDYGNAQFMLDPIALEYAENSDRWSEQVTRLKEEVEEWWGRAPSFQFRFTPALKVWRRWLERGAPIHSLLSPIRNDNPDSISELKQAVNRVSNDYKVRTEANVTAYQSKGRDIGADINATALNAIQRHTKEAVEFAKRWISLQEHRPSAKSDYRLGKLLELRTAVDVSREGIAEELTANFKSAEDVRVRTAVRCCTVALERLASALHPNRKNSRSNPDAKYILSSSLLLIPGLQLSQNWEVELEQRSFLRILIESLAFGRTSSWKDAFREHAEKYRNHDATDRIIQYLTWTGEDTELIQSLSDNQKVHVRSCQDALLRRIAECRKRIENGVARGLVGDKERAAYLQVAEGISDRAYEIRNFGEAESELDRIFEAIDRSKTLLAEQVVQTMEERGISAGHPAFNRIMKVVENGDIDTATEYIELASRDEGLPDSKDIEDKFGTFFPRVCSIVDDFLSDPKLSGSLLSRIESQKGLPGVEMRRLPEAKAKDATEMLESWLSLKKAKRANTRELRILFERLGFNVLSISESASQPRAWIALQVKVLDHRDECAIPYFGSLANGNYRVLCIWDHPSEEEIINLIRPGKLGSPAIVLYFDRLTEMQRRSLASLSHADHLSFLLIDQILIIYLCSEFGARMPALFQCTLPFAYINPYVTTSSIVPPEMFYGRKYERRQIMDPMGSCFVYGGRQLGKTALLMSIRDEFHNPAEGRIAVWFDLKAAGVTQDDIWPNLAHAFITVSATGLDLEKKRTEHGIIEQIQTWLSEDGQRRILLLLDEADRFLESDAKDGFKRTSILKGLMERTNRHFKVVFAGLHNVQRTTKQQNHPLAHFGEPICIGPLLDRGESKEARALIEYPLNSMGFRFESQDLVTRILAQTNYYPSLIQLYCNQLFQFLTRESPASFDWHTSPPFLITAKHVEDAYASRQLRSAIRERFELTLNLDLRYRVIALIIALYSHSNEEQQPFGSMAIADIRKHAVYFWERGFHDCRSEEDFRVLLDEMVGLGVLQEVNGRFALRTPNVKSLLGTQDEIESKLMLCAQEEPPPVFEAHVFRTSDQKEVWKRNPLTALQESGLRMEKNAVTILFGTRAAGLDDLNPFLARAFGEPYYVTCGKQLTDRHDLRRRLAEIKEKLSSGTTIVIVQDCLWTEQWVEEAIELCRKKTVSKFVNVAFVSDPATTWRTVHSRNRLEELVSQRHVSIVGLQPWHPSVLWQWLGDCRIGTNATDEQALISQKTGNWPYLLMEFRKKALGEYAWKPLLDEIYSSLSDKGANSDFVGAFGLSIPEVNKILREMALLGGSISVADLISLLDPLSETLIENTIYWADRLSLIRRRAKEEWELDPIVARVLATENKK